MKFLLFVISLLLAFSFQPTPLLAQQDFAPIGAEWYYSSSARGAAPTGSEFFYLLAEKDTSINSLSLRKIKRTYYNFQGDTLDVPPYYVHQSGDTVSLYDQDRDKLYRLLVFNATQGDTLLLDVPFPTGSIVDSTYRVVVDTIESESYGGVQLDKYVLEPLGDYGWFVGFYLEKVGGFEWFFPLGLIIIPESDGPIRCYKDSDVDINFSSRACDFRILNSLGGEFADRFRLFPNPAADYLELQTDLRIDRMELMDAAGRILLQTKDLRLDVSALPKGMYFLKAYAGEHSLIRKVMKN
jgi:hypothetical protein